MPVFGVSWSLVLSLLLCLTLTSTVWSGWDLLFMLACNMDSILSDTAMKETMGQGLHDLGGGMLPMFSVETIGMCCL